MNTRSYFGRVRLVCPDGKSRSLAIYPDGSIRMTINRNRQRHLFKGIEQDGRWIPEDYNAWLDMKTSPVAKKQSRKKHIPGQEQFKFSVPTPVNSIPSLGSLKDLIDDVRRDAKPRKARKIKTETTLHYIKQSNGSYAAWVCIYDVSQNKRVRHYLATRTTKADAERVGNLFLQRYNASLKTA